MAKLCGFTQKLRKLANSKQVDVVEDVNGRFRLVSKNSRGLLGVFDSEAEAREFL